jgi:hypothetical protein
MHRRTERNFSKTSTGLTAGKEPFVPGDTIAAISTPAGEGAIALVRISGVNAIEVARFFVAKKSPRNLHHMFSISARSSMTRAG